MNINIHIERLILDGLPVERRHGPLVQAALEAELARLLFDGHLKNSLTSGTALPRLSAPDIQMNGREGPAALGREIARTLYASIGDVGTGNDGRVLR